MIKGDPSTLWDCSVCCEQSISPERVFAREEKRGGTPERILDTTFINTFTVVVDYEKCDTYNEHKKYNK